MPKSDLQNKTLDELETMLKTYMKERMNLRFQKSMGQLEKPSRFKVVRKEIARIKYFFKFKEEKGKCLKEFLVEQFVKQQIRKL